MHAHCIAVGPWRAAERAKLSDALRTLPGLREAPAVVSWSSLGDWMSWTASPSKALESPPLVVSDAVFADPDWAFVRVRLAENGRFFAVLVRDRPGSDGIVHALREGAWEAFLDGEPADRWASALRSTQEAEAHWRRLFGDTQAPAPSDGLVGCSASLQRLRELIARVAPTRASVLVVGESGTGKERVAQALHAAYCGEKGPFVALNCTALPRELIEAELFGASRGAYTGAVADRPGLVEQAHGGTLFLDEIGDLDPALQPKLLRFLETRRARRLGAKSDYAVDVRIVAATHADLAARVASGRFREDLYYRLAEITIEVPPLRERPEDIPSLCRHFLALAAERHGGVVTSIEPELVRRLQAWSWPGNIRELRSAIERLVILSNGPVLRDSAWSPPPRLITPPSAPAAAVTAPRDPEPVSTPNPELPGDATAPLNKRQRRELALRLLAESGGDQAWVAARLGIHPTTLYRWRIAAERATPRKA